MCERERERERGEREKEREGERANEIEISRSQKPYNSKYVNSAEIDTSAKQKASNKNTKK